ncbi:MAG: hypothetical protein NTZ09_02660 [Candidatus Hydrogenedentes bacterium]|nr:hypothetical protein [Candidatus Hydrogenedentota bacterium]
MSKTHCIATKARKTTVKPSDVLDLSSKALLSSTFLLWTAIRDDSNKQIERLLDGQTGKQDYARIARETLGIDCEGIESVEIHPWQVEEMNGETWVVIRDADGLKYVWVDPLFEWIDHITDRPLSWKDYFAMYGHASGEIEQARLIYPWQIEAIISQEEWRAVNRAGCPRNLHGLLGSIREVAWAEAVDPKPQGG